MKTNYIVKYQKEWWYDSTTPLHKWQVSRTCPRTRVVGPLKWLTIFTKISTISRICAIQLSALFYIAQSVNWPRWPIATAKWKSVHPIPLVNVNQYVCSTLGRIRGERRSFCRDKPWWVAALASMACLTVMRARVDLIVVSGNDKLKRSETCAFLIAKGLVSDRDNSNWPRRLWSNEHARNWHWVGSENRGKMWQIVELY